VYTSYAEVWEAVERIRRAVAERRYEHYVHQRLAVT
jgi:hypothetical protein